MGRRRHIRGVEYEGIANPVPPGLSIPKKAPRGLANQGDGTNVVTVPTGLSYSERSFYLASQGQTVNGGGTPITPKALADFNPGVLGQWGFSFPGEAGDLNSWNITTQLPPNYDSSRPVIATLHIIQEDGGFDTSDFIAYWPMEAVSAASQPDSTGHGLTAVPVITTPNPPSRVTGKVSYGAGFGTPSTFNPNAGGLSGYKVTADALLEMPGSDYTLWGWYLRDDPLAGNTLVYKADSWSFGEFTTGGTNFGFFDINYGVGAFTRLTAATPSGYGAWRFWMVEYITATRTANLYTNNVSSATLALDDTDTLPLASYFSGTDLYLGQIGAFGQSRMDETGIASRVFTTDEKNCIFDAGAGSTWPDFCNG